MHDKVIRKGDMIFVSLIAADTDPQQFPDPELLNIRHHENPHLTFSKGIHYCLGAPLARLEGQIAIGTLLKRLPPALIEDHVWRQAWMKVLPLYFHTYDPQIGVAMDEAMQYSGKAFVHGNTRCLPTFNALHKLDTIEAPTLVMAGRYDWITPPIPGAERIHAALPDSKLVIFEQSGHFPFIEEQDKFIATVSAWMASLR